MKNTEKFFSYDPEADAAMFSVGEKASIDYASEFGDVIVNFSKDGQPVLIEILNASKFFSKYKEPFAQMAELA